MSAERVLPRLSLLLLCAAILPACAFVEAAGEISVGAPQVPHVQVDINWPTADQIIGGALKDTAKQAPPGFPTSLDASTLAHLQGLMNVDGECHRALTIPEVKAQSAAQLKNLTVLVTNCGDPGRCIARCQGFQGMLLEARVQYQLLEETKAKEIKKILSDETSPDAIVQIRTRFSKLKYYQKEGDKKVETGSLFAASELGVSSVGGLDDTVLVKQRYLSKISEKTPQRFELDPRAPFTKATKQAVIDGKTIWIEIFQRLAVPQGNLYRVKLGGGGVELDFQPEFVINAIEVAKGQL